MSGSQGAPGNWGAFVLPLAEGDSASSGAILSCSKRAPDLRTSRALAMPPRGERAASQRR